MEVLRYLSENYSRFNRYGSLEGWNVETGPLLSVVESSWTFIAENLTESKYRNLGGPFRLVIEDFMKRCAAKIELKVKFNSDGKYTGGDFVTVENGNQGLGISDWELGIRNWGLDVYQSLLPTPYSLLPTPSNHSRHMNCSSIP